jgi:adenine-specific DNA glycosylase
MAAKRPFFVVRHTITRYRILLEAFDAQKPTNVQDGVWKTVRQMDSLAFTSAHRKLLNAVRG